jgi:hypothetical protein
MRCAALAGLIALTLAGCGGGDSDPAAEDATPAQVRAEVQRVWSDVIDATRAGDGARFCGHATPRYTRKFVSEFGTTTCVEATRRAAKLVNETLTDDAKPRFSQFSTRGDRATIHVTLPTEDVPAKDTVRFLRVGGEWKVDGESALDAQ